MMMTDEKSAILMMMMMITENSVIFTIMTGENSNYSDAGRCELHERYVVGSKSFRPDQLFKVTEIKQLCHFST